MQELWSQNDVTNKIGAKGELDVFMHKNKEVFAFIGTDLIATKEKDKDMTLGKNTPYHFCLRWNAIFI
ncbi:hypothetical protein [Streptobacillus notomytis]|uniref:hypothetical protein n=1 Tax=Streptobacillus notomytis TaxID=1712031 RepID=UPI0009359BD2|nr:hypothetical protein [Streptobacillus notomytis]